jgi:hypothetical protein
MIVGKSGQLAAIAVSLLLASCDSQFRGKPVGSPYAIPNILTDISFMGAHQEERCSKGCRYIRRPDTWYLQFCQLGNAGNCFVEDIAHAPWKWQIIGVRVDVMWQKYEGGYRFPVSYRLDGAEVSL